MCIPPPAAACCRFPQTLLGKYEHLQAGMSQLMALAADAGSAR
jgi:hypothetical protein